jgi:monomeric sarcosine oxidase
VEVAVLGGGIVGASTAQALARHGREVLLLERFDPGHDRGSSHGDGRIIRYAYPEAIYLQMAKLAYAAWARLEQDSAESLLQTTGNWDCGATGSQALADLQENLQRFDIPHERLSATESNRRFPQFHLAPGFEALYQEAGGIVRAGLAVSTLWRLAAAAGVHCVSGATVVAIETDADGVLLVCQDGRRFAAERLVVAAGGWAGGLLRELGLELPLVVTDELLAYFPPNKGGPDHRVGAMPTVIDHHLGPHFYALPQIDLPGVKVGWHHSGPEVAPDQRSAPSAERLAALAGYVQERFPHLGTEPIATATCLYSNTPDTHFILDHHPEHPGIVIGAGFSGHGFKFGPVLGDILAQFVLGGPTPVPLELFRLDRFTA